MKRNLHSETKVEATKTTTREKMFALDKPDQKMGVKHAKIDKETGEPIRPSSAQTKLLKHQTSKKRRQHEHYSEDIAEEV